MDYSVVIPAYNAAKTILECLQSVFDQTMPPAQVIVVDDGSQDETAKLVQNSEFDVTVISITNSGPGTATTKGFEQVQHEFIATLDSDDLWRADKIQQQLAFLEGKRDYAGVFTHIQSFNVKENPNDAVPGWLRSTMLIRKHAQMKIGPMVDPKPYGGEFIGWIGTARDLGMEFSMLDEPLALRRIRKDSLSYGLKDPVVAGYLSMARQSILRKRTLTARDT